VRGWGADGAVSGRKEEGQREDGGRREAFLRVYF
jgi:hypothetical protein